MFQKIAKHRANDASNDVHRPPLRLGALVKMVATTDDLTMKVPSTHPPKYTIDPGVSLVPINGLARLDKSWEKYVVIGEKIIKGLKDVSLIGAGKTGIDAVLRLLDLGVDQVIFF